MLLVLCGRTYSELGIYRLPSLYSAIVPRTAYLAERLVEPHMQTIDWETGCGTIGFMYRV